MGFVPLFFVRRDVAKRRGCGILSLRDVLKTTCRRAGFSPLE
ncbi:hypothetical protein HMPREF9080_01305 [Cardiobacterium valvarum F0432]|uniref:Uncharacterized protein n=1 Tax=Cardiobacterium valvarum F0432 TaxID=797473 RepID=G9ZEW5_9GAMM|nr:hypothetical protein HMPREF9080_01305 [Cardiobacterium valvarum F0432]